MNGSGVVVPGTMNEFGRMASGAFSRLSIVVTCPRGVRMTMKPPPPMPAENGSVTPSTPAAATAASTALPPRRIMSIAACVASRSTVAAAPPEPTAVGIFAAGGGGGWWSPCPCPCPCPPRLSCGGPPAAEATVAADIATTATTSASSARQDVLLIEVPPTWMTNWDGTPRERGRSHGLAAVLAGPGQQREAQRGAEDDHEGGDLLHAHRFARATQAAINTGSSADEGLTGMK